MTPYNKYIKEAKEVMQYLISLMCKEEDMKRFRNIMAVYVVWQQELHNLEVLVIERL